MREYDETTLKVAERVLKRSEEIVRQRQIRTTKIRHISYAVTGLCAAAILCFGILNFSKFTQGFNPDPHGNYQNTTSDTTIESKTTVTSTTTVTGTETSTSTTFITTTTATTTSDIVTTTDIEETYDENEVLDDPIENTEEHEDVPIVPVTPEEPTVPATKAVVQPTLCGDVNGDKLIDIEDPSIIIYYVNNKNKITWAECYKNNKASNSKLSAEQALANADAFKASDKREITREDAEAILGYINGKYPELPINELQD